MTDAAQHDAERSWVDLELEDDFDEELEQEIDDSRVPAELRELLARHKRSAIDRDFYFRELLRLQSELVKFQEWVAHKKLKVVVLFEGRDSAGTDEEQQFRFLMRIHDPIKQWKLSPMDLQSRVRWEHYTKAKEDMFARTSIPEAPWHIVEGNDKKRARLNCTAHLLSRIPYEEVPHDPIRLPERVYDPNYERRTLPADLYVPDICGEK
jgi:polyphosphate kinase 2 (PPK2 family)